MGTTITALLVTLLLIWGWDHYIGNTFSSFRGRVVSIDGSPVIGATVDLHVVTYNFFQFPVLWGTMYGKTTSMTATTDARGEFHLGAIHGHSLDIMGIKKAGFDQFAHSPDRGTFVLTGPGSELTPTHVPTYIMVPRGPSAGNVQNSLEFRPPRDGSTSTVDFVTARVTPTPQPGNLQISITGPKILDYRPPERFSWGVTISVFDGELIETHDPVGQRAPADGYRASYVYQFSPTTTDWKTNDPAWSYELHRRFYVRSRDGKRSAWCDVTAVPRRGIEGNAAVELYFVYSAAGSPDLFSPPRS